METASAADAFAALGQPTRLAALRSLVRAGPTGLPAGELARALAVPPATLSFHLRHLERAGLATHTRRSRQIVYSADYAGLRALLGFLTEDCCGGRPEICGDLARLAACAPASEETPP